MKLTFILLLAACLSAAGSYAQQVTLKLKDVPAKEVITAVEKQTGFVFFYKAGLLEGAGRVSIDVENVSVEELLKKCFEGKGIGYVVKGKNVWLRRGGVTEQLNKEPPVKVSGVIMGLSNQLLAGATVKVKGKNIFTVSDERGSFELNTEPGSILLISYVGFEEKEYKVQGSDPIMISLLQMRSGMDTAEVVLNTGYQKISSERATGSYAFIDNKTLNTQVGTNILKRLEGVTSGLLFDNNKVRGGGGFPTNDNISIRGISTINASMDPLIVLDGYIYDGKIDNINPNDIDNINVLKDAAATSIWGAKASNGVIVISTKKGKLNQKPIIGINVNTIIKEKPDLYALPQMDPKDYIYVEQILFNQGFFNNRINRKFLSLTPAVEIFLKKRLGLISSEDSAQLIDKLTQTDTRDEYLKYIYTNPVTQQYNVGVRGGGINNAYTLSVSYDDIKTDINGRDRKLNVLLNNIFQPLKWLKTEVGLYYTAGRTKRPDGKTYGSLLPGGRIAPYFRLFDDNGSALPLATIYNPQYTDTLLNSRLPDWKYYPGIDHEYSYTTIEMNDFFVNGGLQLKIQPWLTFDFKGQYQRQVEETNQVSAKESYRTRDLINSATQYNITTGELTYRIPMGDIVQIQSRKLETFTGRTQLNIDKQWRAHQINAITGFEIRDAKIILSDRYSIYGYNSDPRVSIPVDFVNSYQHLISKNSLTIQGYPVGGGETVNRFVSVYSNFSYTYNNRYTFSASARRDGSNLFGVVTNDRWEPLWSIGGMWKVSAEKFYHSNLFNSMNFRVTYGFSGNVDLAMTAIPIGTYDISYLSNLPSAQVRVLNNPNLRWEKSGMLNLGLDFSIKNSILSGSVDYYRRKSTDLYGQTLYDYTTWGYTNEVTINSAGMIGSGWDVILNARILNRAFKWSSSILFNYSTNRVTVYKAADVSIYGKLNSSNLNEPVIGRSLYSAVAFRWGGLNDQGSPQGYVDGKLSTDYGAIGSEAIVKGIDGNLKYMGSSVPLYFGSFSNTFVFKRITLSTLISYKLKYYISKPALSYSQLRNEGIGTTDFQKRWQMPGDEKNTNVPAFLSNLNQNTGERDFFYKSSEVNILRGDNVRIQFVNLSYSIMDNKRRLLKDIQIYLNASNLGIIWHANKEGLDPDYPTSIPPSRTYAIGVRANF